MKELQDSVIISDKEIQLMTSPYQTDTTLTQKVQLTYQTLLHSTRMRNRSLSLVNAYYLGQLIDAATTSPAQCMLQIATLTKHYYRTAI